MSTVRRYGKFTIPRYLVETMPDVVKSIMGQCIILRAEAHLINDTIRYDAISDRFRGLRLGEIVPKYEIILHNDKFERFREVE